MVRIYKFDNAEDMIALAMEVQTRVYWGSSFVIREGEEDEETVSYSSFWDYVESAHKDGYVAVTIVDEKYVIFSMSVED